MEKIVYFLNPSGKVLKDSSIKKISANLMEDEPKGKMYYRAGKIANTPSRLLNELKNSKLPWDVVVVEDNVKIHVLDEINKNKFLQKLAISEDSVLAGKIAIELLQ